MLVIQNLNHCYCLNDHSVSHQKFTHLGFLCKAGEMELSNTNCDFYCGILAGPANAAVGFPPFLFPSLQLTHTSSFLSICFTLSLESAPCVSQSASSWSLCLWLTSSYICHIAFCWFTALDIHNFLTFCPQLKTHLFHKSFTADSLLFEDCLHWPRPFLMSKSFF